MKALRNHRDYWTIFWLGITGAACLFPFMAYHIIYANWILLLPAGSTWIVLLAMAIETWITRQVPMRSLFAFGIIASFSLLLAIYYLGLAGSLWSFPVITFIYYLLGTRLASYIMLLLFPLIVLVASAKVDGALLPRLTVTIAFTWFVAGVFSANIDRQRRELEKLAYNDPLTGAGNRREMTTELRRAVNLKNRYNTPASLLIMDIDHFKLINDHHGHQVGDQVLIDLTRYTTERLRKSDLFFRAGGEEFVVLLPETDCVHAAKLAGELVLDIPSHPMGGIDSITVSIGVAELKSGEYQDDWFTRADRALYHAKACGRQRAEIAA